MTSEQQLSLLSHIAYCAKFYIALRCSLDKMIELIRYSIGEAAPEPDQIRNFMMKESTQRLLESTYETALWRSNDRNKSWRLISLAVKPDPEVAQRRLNKKPPSPQCCGFCWQDESIYADALNPELDVYNQPTGIYLHRQCSRPFKLLRDLVARAPNNRKESLL